MYISKATVIDTEELTALVNSAYRGESSKQGWTSEAHLLGGQRIDDITVLSYLQNNDDVTLLKCTGDDGAILACVYLEQKSDKLYLGMLTVSPLAQNQGIGKKLLAAGEEHARGLGCHAITITVISSRAELIAWYVRLGFADTGEIRPFPTDERFGIAKAPIELIVMEKKLW